MTPRKKTGKFDTFYALFEQMGFKSDDRRDFIADFTEGKYMSLTDLYDNDLSLYNWMIAQMQIKVAEYRKTKSKLRQQLIAAIFAHFERQELKVNIDYVKTVACRAAKCDDFNKIPEDKLRSLIHEFNNKKVHLQPISSRTQQRLAMNFHLN